MKQEMELVKLLEDASNAKIELTSQEDRMELEKEEERYVRGSRNE